MYTLFAPLHYLSYHIRYNQSLYWGADFSINGGLDYKNTKENKKIYNENTMGRHVQSMIRQDDFMEDLRSWLFTIEDERILLARKFLFEVDLSDTEQLKDTLYSYGSHLTEKNYVGRKFFGQMADILRQMELNRSAASS